MKATKIAAVICVLALAASLFGCRKTDRDPSSNSLLESSGTLMDSIEDMLSSDSEPMDDIISGDESSETSLHESGLSSEPDGFSFSDASDVEDNLSSDVSATMGTDFEQIGALDGTSNGWGPGVNRGDDGRPLAPVMFQEKYGEYAVDFIRPEKGVIYLTFDEGYENGYTPAILDTLKEKQVTAVFFVTLSYAKYNPELIQRMIDEGHIVGNHSSTHPDMTSLSLQDAYDDIMQLHEHIKENFGYEMKLFRFPMGVYSEQTLALLQSMGYRSVFWSFAYKDWETDNQPDPTNAYERITGFAHDGAIYLLHAVSSTNTSILADVIDSFREQGYTLAAYPQ